MAERLVTLAQLQQGLAEILGQVEQGETVVLIDDQPGRPPSRKVVLLGAAAYAQLSGATEQKKVEKTVGGVAGGLVAGAGTAISTVTGKPEVARGARSLGRRLGRALAVGIDALDEKPKGKQ